MIAYVRELPWRLFAWIIARPAVLAWLIKRGRRTPYYPIMSRDGSELYMERLWLFNPYGKDAAGDTTPPRFEWLPSVRLHHIMVEDDDEHMHDHPWNARTIVMGPWYTEERPARFGGLVGRSIFVRGAGYTGRLLFGEYHRISCVPEGGVWTVFFTWRYRGTWGFDVNGTKIPYKTYLGERA
jgi:hypothetical protein